MRTNKSLTSGIARLLTVCAVLGFLPAAFAASTWNFGTTANGCTQTVATGPGDTDNRGNSWSCNPTGGGPTTTVTAWSATSTSNFSIAEVARYGDSGFGVRNTVSGGTDYEPSQHSLDNDGRTDLMLFYFGGTQVSLDFVKMGWTTNDSDFSLLAYTGADQTPTQMATKMTGYDTTGVGAGQDGLVTGTPASGWSLVNHFPNVSTNNTAVTVAGLNPNGTAKAGDTYSSWWIVSAYNSGYGGTALDNVADYVKLVQLSGEVKPGTGVPEPGTLALVGVAMIGMFSLRRRSRGAGI